MTSELFAVSFAAQDPGRLETFWSRLLGRDLDDAGAGLRIRFAATGEPKTGPNRGHFDLTSDSLDMQRRTVARALELGARHIDVGQRPEEEHVVLADPEGNEFCVIEPGNNFLAGCGFIGALACDGSRQAGYFWSAALGWPLVWDRDEETAIQSPRGGSKISWGGAAPALRNGADRVRLELVPAVGEDLEREIERLLSLGATRTETGLADPDGAEFCLLAPR